MLAALALREIGATRPMWLLDTYDGMPPPSARDKQWTGEHAADRLAGQERISGAINDWAFATLDDVKEQMASVGYPPELLHFRQGACRGNHPRAGPCDDLSAAPGYGLV